MTKNKLLHRATVVWLLLLAAGLTVVACGTAAPTEPAEASDPVEAVPATEEATDEVTEATEAVEEETEAEATSEEVVATEEVAAVEQEQAIEASPPASCVPIDIPDNELIPAPTEDDWALGPETAAITVIEYGDFQ